MSRRLIAWLVTLPLAVAGTQVAHVLAYRLTTATSSERAHALSASGHGYAAYVPLALAIGAVLVAFALAAEVRQIATGPARSPLRPTAWHFAVVAPALFACQEHLERLLHSGGFPWGVVLGASFLVGLLLQLPVALAAYLLARLLLRAARSIGDLLARRRPGRVWVSTARWRVSDFIAPLLPALAHGYGSRGPPLALR